MKKLLSYLLFLQIGIQRNAKTGDALNFVTGELKRLIRRFRHRNSVNLLRRKFNSATYADYINDECPEKLQNVVIFSLCYGEAVPEQKLSIKSFLRYVGTPAKWTIVSDGSITIDQKDSLRSLHPSIDIRDWSEFLCEENASCFEELSKYTVFAKKFALMSNLPDQGAVVYIDTDILFFEGAHHLRDLLKHLGKNCYYLTDTPECLDPTFLEGAELKVPPLNAGFVIQGKKLDWSEPIARINKTLAQLSPVQKMGDLGVIEQSATHLAHFLAGSKPLNEKYVLEISDILDPEDRFSGPSFAMRHYVRPVRHKMWMHSTEYLRNT